MTNSNMTCDAFDAALPDYLEETLNDSLRASVEMHLRECVRCAGLVRDIENIRKEAAALPDLVPARDLWEGIDARIAAPVIPLSARPERQRRVVPAWMGVAAAALVMSTAGITYVLTARSLAPAQNGPVAVITPSGGETQAQAQGNGGSIQNPSGSSGGAPEQVDGGSLVNAAQRGGTPAQRAATPASLASRDQGPSASDVVYGKEIELLQKIVNQRRTQLDSSTVAIIERNLQIIDNAIQQSRAALAKDPASLLLSEQLTHALDKKVELLRTAAMLPAST
jgi:hypothetical protein